MVLIGLKHHYCLFVTPRTFLVTQRQSYLAYTYLWGWTLYTDCDTGAYLWGWTLYTDCDTGAYMYLWGWILYTDCDTGSYLWGWTLYMDCDTGAYFVFVKQDSDKLMYVKRALQLNVQRELNFLISRGCTSLRKFMRIAICQEVFTHTYFGCAV